MNGIRHGNRHDDDGDACVDRREHCAEPACNPHGAQEQEHENDRDGKGGVERTQEESRHSQDDDKNDWEKDSHIFCGVGESLVQNHIAGQEKGEVRMGIPGIVEQVPQMV